MCVNSAVSIKLPCLDPRGVQGCQVRLEEAVVFVLSLITWSLLPLLPVEVSGRVLQGLVPLFRGVHFVERGHITLFLLGAEVEPRSTLHDFILFK